jgi:ferredoxin-NADP reductase
MKFIQAFLSSTSILSSSLAGAFLAPSSKQGSPSTFLVRKSSQLFAEGGAPQYEKRTAILRHAEVLGEGTVMLHIERDDDMPLEYQPGNVLALEIQQDDDGNFNEKKNTEDTVKNGGWMRGPYTVSRGSESSFDIMIKVVGDKSKRLASAEPGTPLRFGGNFKVPIYEGIQKESTERVVLLSTGVGIGPCVGAIEEMLTDEDFLAKVDLFASFRTEGEVVYREYLDSLVAKHPDQFQWKAIITSTEGRISDSEENARMIINFGSVKDTTHYHLIGNGQLVNEWKSGLAKAGVSEDKVTFEAYFNHKATSNENAIETIASVIAASSALPVA